MHGRARGVIVYTSWLREERIGEERFIDVRKIHTTASKENDLYVAAFSFQLREVEVMNQTPNSPK